MEQIDRYGYLMAAGKMNPAKKKNADTENGKELEDKQIEESLEIFAEIIVNTLLKDDEFEHLVGNVSPRKLKSKLVQLKK